MPVETVGREVAVDDEVCDVALLARLPFAAYDPPVAVSDEEVLGSGLTVIVVSPPEPL